MQVQRIEIRSVGFVASSKYYDSTYDVGLKVALFGMHRWMELICTVVRSGKLQAKTKHVVTVLLM
jgi:hypothetical protein